MWYGKLLCSWEARIDRTKERREDLCSTGAGHLQLAWLVTQFLKQPVGYFFPWGLGFGVGPWSQE